MSLPQPDPKAVLPVPLYRAEQVRELDRRAIEEFRVPGYTLMCHAGQAAFEALRARWPAVRRLAVVCGLGNNGGDGYVIARLARMAGFDAHVLTVGDPAALQGDARRAAEDWQSYGGDTHPFAAADLAAAEVVVDALLGTGLERPVAGELAVAVEAINGCGRPVLAVDIPSGLHADTGAVLGVAVEAALTVSFIGLKPGLFTGAGPDHCGEVRFHDLEVPAGVYDGVEPVARRIEPVQLELRRPTSHKGEHGHVLVIGGDRGMGGAARLAGEAALRCGAGLVSLATRPEHAAALSAIRPELMVHGIDAAEPLAPLLERATVIAIGPGLGQGEWGRALWRAALAAGKPLVLDADALNLLAESPMRADQWVLTPHPGEAARLLGVSTSRVQADRLAAAADLQGGYGGVCVLKGAGSLVAAPEGLPALCNAGNAGMASGGMGDLLCGVIAAQIAQGHGLFEAARDGVWLHATAADCAAAEGGQRGLIATDLLSHLRRLVN